MSEQQSDSPDDKAVQLAKAELREVDRRLNMLSAERMKIEMQQRTAIQQRDRLSAFIDLYARFVHGDANEPPRVAAAVLSETKPPASDQHEQSDPHRAKKSGRRKSTKLARKPDDIPTMPEMIVKALENAKTEGREGLRPSEIKDYIAKKWWPTVKGSAVGPIAWRMFDRNELQKDGEVYSLPLMRITRITSAQLRKEAAE